LFVANRLSNFALILGIKGDNRVIPQKKRLAIVVNQAKQSWGTRAIIRRGE
jgi:hypothetical protein